MLTAGAMHNTGSQHPTTSKNNTMSIRGKGRKLCDYLRNITTQSFVYFRNGNESRNYSESLKVFEEFFNVLKKAFKNLTDS
jgi:hypothetical protein